MKVPQGMPLVRMKAAPVKTDGERLGNEFMNGVFFSAQMMIGASKGEFYTNSRHPYNKRF